MTVELKEFMMPLILTKTFTQTNKIVLTDIYYLSICEISQCKYSSESQNGDTKTDPQNAGVLTHQPKLLQMPKNRCLTLLPGK